MSDLPSSLGIEAVECVAEGGRNLTVRVTGRWRRRRPELRGQPMLVVETESGRQRFLAMPEPPSLTGAAPGTWRMSFSVPVALAPVLPGRTFLQLGGVMVPLPIGELAIAAEDIERPDGSGPDLLEARRARGSELAAESARRRATELSAEVGRLERELGEARTESDRLRDTIAEGERRLRRAEQHIHAERALRSELEQELTRRTRGAQHDLRVLHDRVAELERELSRMRRAVDEAGHLAAAAEAARAAAERRLAEPASPPPAPSAIDGARAERSRRERELDRAARGAPRVASPPRPLERAGDRTALGQEAAIAARRTVGAREDPERLAVLERELAAAHEEVEAQRRRSARAYEAIALVRTELRELRMAAPEPPAVGDSDPVIRPATPPEPVQAERLSEALARLRERTPAEPGPVESGPVESGPVESGPVESGPVEPAPVEPAESQPLVERFDPARATRPWLHPAFRRLAAQDATAAGRLLLALLPAQRAADPAPVAYDLVLSDVVVAHVTSDSLAVHIEHDATARPSSEVDFRLVGDLASVARLLRAGRVRRRLRVPPGRMARIRGDRRRLAALDRLIEARLTLRDLDAAGVRLDPVLAFTLAGLMIEPGWTAGERFTIGHQESTSTLPDAYLHIRDGRPPLASAEPPHTPVSTILVSPFDQILGVVAGASGGQVVGEERPLALVRQWLDRAQSG